MKISDLMQKYDFHDSSIQDIVLSSDTELIIYIELCNWRQAGYQANEPEIVNGYLSFSGVVNYHIVPSLHKFDYEILSVEIGQSLDSDDEQMKIVIRATEDVAIINIQASDVEWKEYE